MYISFMIEFVSIIYFFVILLYINIYSTGLHDPILIKQKKTGKIVINFDILINEIIQETRIMKRLDLNIPKIAVMMLELDDKLMKDSSQIKV